jgi:hypothetical protein
MPTDSGIWLGMFKKDSVPEECSCHTDDDGEAGKVPSEGRSHCNREGHVKTSSEDTVKYKRDGTAKRTEDDADNSLTIGQSHGEDGGWSFPTLSVQGIGEPETGHGEGSPSTALKGRDVHINVGPESVSKNLWKK